MKSLLTLGRILAALLTSFILAAPASAQVSTFDLSGTVLDASGAVLPGVTLTLQNTKTGLVRTEITDTQGRYHFIALPVVGEYALRSEMQGFASEHEFLPFVPGRCRGDRSSSGE